MVSVIYLHCIMVTYSWIMKYSITLTLFMPMDFSTPSEKHRKIRNFLMLSESIQGSKIGVRRVRTYAWFWICARSHVRSFFPDFLKFKTFFWFLQFILFKNLLLYIWAYSLVFTFVLKKPNFSSFSYKLFNKYFSLSQSTCQFRVSVRKYAKIVMRMSLIFIILL